MDIIGSVGEWPWLKILTAIVAVWIAGCTWLSQCTIFSALTNQVTNDEAEGEFVPRYFVGDPCDQCDTGWLVIMENDSNRTMSMASESQMPLKLKCPSCGAIENGFGSVRM